MASDEAECEGCGAARARDCACVKPLDMHGREREDKLRRLKTEDTDTAKVVRAKQGRKHQVVTGADYEPTAQDPEERQFRAMPWPIL